MEAIYKLKRNDVLTIGTVNYSVKGFLELRQGSFKWKELLLINVNTREEVWLNLEQSTEDIILYKKVQEDDFSIQKEQLKVFESGKGKVIGTDNIEGVLRNDTVEFTDYTFIDNTGKLFSYEKWKDEDEYFIGEQIPLAEVKTSGPNTLPVTETRKRSNKYWTSLALGQKLKIKGKQHYIAGFARFRQNSFRWTEYKLSGGGKELWLSVENIDNKRVELSLFQSVSLNKVTFTNSNKKASCQGIDYDCIDTGNGRVTESIGNVDFDYSEAFAFREYQSEDGKLLSFEKWSDESEVSLGEIIQESDIEILEGKKKIVSSANPSKYIGWIITIAVFAVFFIPAITSLFEKPIISGVKNNMAFSYVTSVTSNDKSNTKSYIYQSRYSPDETCKLIIKMDPENIEKVITSKDAPDKEIFLQSKKEIAMIYQSEDSTTYVQLSKNTQEETGYTSYRAYNPYRLNHFYLSSMRWRNNNSNSDEINTSKYNVYLSSARQESVNARRTQGGGTSFGK